MKITPLDIRQMQFPKGFRGYPPQEVDAFLETLAEEVEEVLRENATLRERLEEQAQTISELKKAEGALTDTLIMAQKAIENMKATAQKEGELIIRQAEIRAEEITQGAVRQVTQLQGELFNLRKQRDLFIEKMRSLISGFEKTLQWESEKISEDAKEINP